jgi:hypothetical protein
LEPAAPEAKPEPPPVTPPPAATPQPSTPSNDPDAPDEPPATDPATDDMQAPSCEPDCGDVSPRVPPEVWAVSSISVTVPRSKGLFTCLDVCPLVLPSELFWGCPCPIDPFVRISVNGVTVGETSPALKRDAVVWLPELELEIGSPDDVITLEAFDHDLDGDTRSEQRIFGCDLAASMLEAGSLQCAKDFATNLGTRSFRITAAVEQGDD